MNELENRIFRIGSSEDFEKLALEVFYFQAKENKVYKEYISYLGINPSSVEETLQIPFLPIEFFKNHKIYSSKSKAEIEFHSSGTGQTGRSKHYVAKRSMYEKSFMNCFNMFYGNPSEYCILALLPSYLEQKNSSLVYMTDYLIKESKNELSGFYLNNFKDLNDRLLLLETKKQKAILLGVSYALLDFGEQFQPVLKNTILMETGGMKGRRREMNKIEFHNTLKQLYNTEAINSEYGMTELLSQSYSKGDNKYFSPPWKKVYARDLYDPLRTINSGRGGLNIIDLPNIYSCSFIATQDLGNVYEDGSFEVIGRYDNSEIRGCNLLVD
ncbi:MAG: acyltransferase [Bacteroidales bacterium]|nr:acyltransferase [Bacteroidales bacterium]